MPARIARIADFHSESLAAGVYVQTVWRRDGANFETAAFHQYGIDTGLYFPRRFQILGIDLDRAAVNNDLPSHDRRRLPRPSVSQRLVSGFWFLVSGFWLSRPLRLPATRNQEPETKNQKPKTRN
jgi:hypothetical protein